MYFGGAYAKFNREEKGNGIPVKLEIPRYGVANMLTIDNVHDAYTDMNLDEAKHTITISKGEFVHIITDVVGVNEEAMVIAVFMKDAVLFELTSGILYLKDAGGTIYSVDSEGETVAPVNDRNIYWVNAEHLRETCECMVYGKFRLPRKSDASRYVSNMGLVLALSRTTGIVHGVKEVAFSGRLLDMMDISCGKVVFAKYMTKAELQKEGYAEDNFSDDNDDDIDYDVDPDEGLPDVDTGEDLSEDLDF